MRTKKQAKAVDFLKSVFETGAMNAATLSKKSGVAAADISNILSGNRVMGSRIFAKFAAVLPDDVLAGFCEAFFCDLLPREGMTIKIDSNTERRSCDDVTSVMESLKQAAYVHDDLRQMLKTLSSLYIKK